MNAVSTTFPRTGKKMLGYKIEQVDDFLESTRRAYDQDAYGPGANDTGDGGVHLTARQIRHTAFVMQKGGYSPQHVDAALERLEDAFAARERERAAATVGRKAWLDEARTTAQVIVDRLSRPAGHRFDRTSVLNVGYSRADVDRFTNKLVKHFKDGFPMTVDDVRTVVFRPQRGGYREAQVDVLMDAVVDVMLAVR
jgi:DivIVA domain-containing protein